MDERKNQNEKVMKIMSTKFKQGQIPLMLLDVTFYNKAISHQAKLVITSTSLYFVQSTSIKKYFKVTAIQYIVLTALSNQMVILYDPKNDQASVQAFRLESQDNFKIIQDVISAREKFCQMREQLRVMIYPLKSLEAIALEHESDKKKGFFSMFGRKKQDRMSLQNRLSSVGQITSVNQKNFGINISQKMYDKLYKNIKVLYISNNESFRFFEENYESEQIGTYKKILRRKVDQGEKGVKKNLKNKLVMLRKIIKRDPSDDKIVAWNLENYKNEQYKEEMLFALQTETHFEVFTKIRQEEKDCQSMLKDHQYLSEKDLRSVFFKFSSMIESSKQIFYSLSPENVCISKDGIIISKIFSCLRHRTQVDYISPEQITKEEFNEGEVKLINLWKVGILLFQLAYGNVPFSIQYLIKMVSQNEKIQIKFPYHSLRTLQFQDFIRSILKVDAEQRGREGIQQPLKQQHEEKWKEGLRKSTWIRKYIKYQN